MIFYSVDQYNVFRKHEDVEMIPTLANTVQTVIAGTQEYDDMQLWANTNGSWVSFFDAPPPPEAIALYGAQKKAEIALQVDQLIGDLLTKIGYGRAELGALYLRSRHARSYVNDGAPLPANCSIIKDSIASGVSTTTLINSVLAFEAELDSVMGTVSGYRRLAVTAIDAAQSMGDIDLAVYNFGTAVGQYISQYTFTNLM